MSVFGNIFARNGANFFGRSEQAVIVHLDGAGLPGGGYRKHDLWAIKDRLTEIIQRDQLGRFYGDEISSAEAKLYMYGRDAERLFAGIEPALRNDPLCRGARVVIQHGKAGFDNREIRL